MKNILFLTHDTSRTGAPIILLYFIQWLKVNHPYTDIHVVTSVGGVLSEDFRNASNNYYDLSLLQPQQLTYIQETKKKFLKKINCYKRKPHPKDILLENLANKNFDLVYANSVASIPVALAIKKRAPHTKIIVHVHELHGEIQRTVGALSSYSASIDCWIAVSKLVQENLIKVHGINEDKIELVYGFTRKIEPIRTEKRDIKNIFIVGSCGKFSHRKGGDIFLLLAKYLKDVHPEVKISFYWVGKIPEQEKINLQLDLEKLRIEDIHFTGEVNNPEDYINFFDLLLLPSREDPFPLVGIEAGMLGKPIICFKGATGISEIIKSNGGFNVPYLSIEKMAEAILKYVKNPEILLKHSEYNQKKFIDYNSNCVAPRIFKLLEEVRNERDE